ncbi:uncharacterized protein MONOS_16931 [Monocercomonoides exilis]|uniref:uncharacterized protein n=1 Tax=Monocercomonoides exilis TaxID=2049356 RepID=UPI003559B4AB|nr:hypothetical protein MONOS_16931 [Monocercomonoides exilis]
MGKKRVDLDGAKTLDRTEPTAKVRYHVHYAVAREGGGCEWARGIEAGRKLRGMERMRGTEDILIRAEQRKSEEEKKRAMWIGKERERDVSKLNPKEHEREQKMENEGMECEKLLIEKAAIECCLQILANINENSDNNKFLIIDAMTFLLVVELTRQSDGLPLFCELL